MLKTERKLFPEPKNTNSVYWLDMWGKDDIGFHNPYEHPLLVKHLDKLTENRQNQVIFFPLCGKALGIAWLASLGHQVVGIEIVQKGVEQFFEENGIDYSVSKVGDFNLYKSKDGRIRIYNGDFFKFTADYEGQIENVWDRAAFVALPPDIRKRYAAHIQSLLKPRFKYLMLTFNYDPTQYGGPPHYVSDDELQDLFGEKCHLEQLDKRQAPPYYGLPHYQLTESIHFLTSKNDQ